MASKFLGVLGALAFVGSCMGGIATYSHVSPHTSLYFGAAIPTPLNTITYANQASVYHPYDQHLEHQPHEHHQLQHHQLQHQQLELQHQLQHHELEHEHEHQHQESHYHHQQRPFVYHKTIATPFNSYYLAPRQLVRTVVRPATSPLVTLARMVLAAPQVLEKPQTVAVAEPATVAVAAAAPQVVDFETMPNYDFSYGVHDSVSGDIKSQVESRSGDSVQGAYSLLDADGYKRTVTYTADDLNGFNAVVKREPVDEHVVVAGVPVMAAPAFLAHASPLHHVPLQQHFQYVPQLTVQHVEQPQQPEREEQQQPQPSEDQQQQQQQQQYPQDQQFPPQSPQFEQTENNQGHVEKEEEGQQQQQPQDSEGGEVSSPNFDDSDVVETRSSLKNNSNQKSQQQKQHQ